MLDFIKSLPERKIIDSGHTLSLLKYKNKIYAYKGEVNFSGITLYIGKDIYSLKPIKQILKNRRWAAAFILENNIHIFCTYHKNAKDLFKFQDIYHYTSPDGINFGNKQIIINGSAPFVWTHNREYFLFYHRKTDYTHDILVKKFIKIKDLANSKEMKIISIPISTKNAALSSPSIIEKNNKFYLLCEYREGNDPWRTILFESKSPFGPFTNRGTVLDNWRACAFQYLLNDRYIVTYSHRIYRKWNISVREALI